jgi:hypothetical protein
VSDYRNLTAARPINFQLGSFFEQLSSLHLFMRMDVLNFEKLMPDAAILSAGC